MSENESYKNANMWGVSNAYFFLTSFNVFPIGSENGGNRGTRVIDFVIVLYFDDILDI